MGSVIGSPWFGIYHENCLAFPPPPYCSYPNQGNGMLLTGLFRIPTLMTLGYGPVMEPSETPRV